MPQVLKADDRGNIPFAISVFGKQRGDWPAVLRLSW